MALAAALALSGVPLDDLTNEFQDDVIDAIMLLKTEKTPDPSPATSPESSSPPSPTSSCFSDNSEISSSTKTLGICCTRTVTNYQFDLIDDFFTNMDFLSQFPYDLQFSFCDRKVLYQNRDLMDLAGNLKETSNWIRHPSDYCSSSNESSEISFQTFSDSFYSKSPVGERPGSSHLMMSCSDDDCSFTETASAGK